MAARESERGKSRWGMGNGKRNGEWRIANCELKRQIEAGDARCEKKDRRTAFVGRAPRPTGCGGSQARAPAPREWEKKWRMANCELKGKARGKTLDARCDKRTVIGAAFRRRSFSSHRDLKVAPTEYRGAGAAIAECIGSQAGAPALRGEQGLRGFATGRSLLQWGFCSGRFYRPSGDGVRRRLVGRYGRDSRRETRASMLVMVDSRCETRRSSSA